MGECMNGCRTFLVSNLFLGVADTWHCYDTSGPHRRGLMKSVTNTLMRLLNESSLNLTGVCHEGSFTLENTTMCSIELSESFARPHAARPARNLTLPLLCFIGPHNRKHIDSPLGIFVDVTVCAACRPSLHNAEIKASSRLTGATPRGCGSFLT